MPRPLSILILCCLFIIAGVSGIIYHADELKPVGPSPEMLWIFAVRLLAVVGGIYALRGANWARWLLLIWIAYHVALSFKHTTSELLVHLALFVIVTYVFFLSKASAFFRSK